MPNARADPGMGWLQGYAFPTSSHPRACTYLQKIHGSQKNIPSKRKNEKTQKPKGIYYMKRTPKKSRKAKQKKSKEMEAHGQAHDTGNVLVPLFNKKK